MAVRRLCATCGIRRVKGAHNRFCSQACVPRSLRQANCRKGRKTFAYRRRALAFRGDLERIGRSTTREDLLDVFNAIYKRAYNSGFQTGKKRRDELDAAMVLPAARDRGAA